MSTSSPLKHRGRVIHPFASPVKTPSQRSSTRTSAASSSPRKSRNKQPLRIRMDLTETQVDRITDAFTSKVSSSPVSGGQRTGIITPSRSTPLSSSGNGSQSERIKGQHRMNRSMDFQNQNHSPTFSELMPKYQMDSVGLAERRRREPPAPIQVLAGRPVARTPQRPLLETVPDLISPLSAEKLNVTMAGYETEASVYSPEDYDQATSTMASPHGRRHHHHHHPHHTVHRGHNEPESPSASGGTDINDEVLKMYTEWVQVQSPGKPADDKRAAALQESLRHNLYLPTPSPLPHPPPPLAAPRMAASKKMETPMFSPLPLYFRGQGFPTVKKGEKTMIGQNGWLERTRSPDKQKQTPQKKTGILDSIKKIAKDMSEQYHPQRRSQQTTREATNTHVLISLDTREQSLLYCELEFHITTALNDYITAELDKGHLVPDNLKKISDWWYQQGRPKVIGFRYDMETQLELINLHLNDFSFHGRRQGNPAEIAGLLHAMKVNARAMRIRTFCQPDSAIAKQLVDAQSLFNLVNATSAQQIALAEVAQFFKAILERERDSRRKSVGEPRKSIMTAFG